MTPRVQRWQSKPLPDGRVFVRYEHQRYGQYNVRTVADVGRVTFERAGHWDYDRCVIEGASDLGRVTVDGAK